MKPELVKDIQQHFDDMYAREKILKKKLKKMDSHISNPIPIYGIERKLHSIIIKALRKKGFEFGKDRNDDGERIIAKHQKIFIIPYHCRNPQSVHFIYGERDDCVLELLPKCYTKFIDKIGQDISDFNDNEDEEQDMPISAEVFYIDGDYLNNEKVRKITVFRDYDPMLGITTNSSSHDDWDTVSYFITNDKVYKACHKLIDKMQKDYDRERNKIINNANLMLANPQKTLVVMRLEDAK